MNTPQVSVIIPVYDTEAYVSQTLDSILGQTLRRIEIIAVDDGSTDGSAAILARAAARDPRIRIVTQPNRGLSEARNAGLDRATGEFVYFMDSDDLLEADALELCYEKCAAQGLDFVFFDAETFGSDSPVERWFDYRRAAWIEDRVQSGRDILEQLIELRKYKASACLSFIRTDFLRDCGLRFHPGIVHEDELFTALLYLQARRAGRIDRAFFKRRLRANSTMTAGYGARNLAGYLTVADELSRFARGADRPTARCIGRLLSYILNPAVYNAWALPARQRRALAGTVLRRYPRRVSPRSLAVLLLKSSLRRLARR